MTHIFNIASAGSTASAWLTINLNKHRLITAFHGLRTHPFGRGLIYPEEMVQGLRKMSGYLSTAEFVDANQSGDTTAIGIIHSYYGPRSRGAFVKNGGNFRAIVRDPISRVNSQFIEHYCVGKNANLDRTTLYETVSATEPLSEASDVFPNFTRDTTKALFDVEDTFLYLCETAIRNDILNCTQCPADEIILFEEMVSSEGYCYEKLSAATGIHDDELKNIISSNLSVKTNTHTTKAKTTTSIFNSWPAQFRHLFTAVLHDVGLDQSLKVYGDLGYTEMVASVEDYLA